MEQNCVDKEIERLSLCIEKTPEDDDLYRQRADLHWKCQNWKAALDDYSQAISLNPSSPAVHLREMLMQIISFYNKDVYNP